jgi:hypothetical protein
MKENSHKNFGIILKQRATLSHPEPNKITSKIFISCPILKLQSSTKSWEGNRIEFSMILYNFKVHKSEEPKKSQTTFIAGYRIKSIIRHQLKFSNRSQGIFRCWHDLCEPKLPKIGAFWLLRVCIIHVCNHVARAIFGHAKSSWRTFPHIINVTPSLWSWPGSSHEDLSMHADTHVHTHVLLLTFGPEFRPKMVVVIWH